MINNPCISPGCQAWAIYGFGSALRGAINFACGEHRHLLNAKAAGFHPAADAGGEGASLQPSPQPKFMQGGVL